jgi:hypothetical protein
MPSGPAPGEGARNTRTSRRLYIGNLPTRVGLTPPLLCAWLVHALGALGMKTERPLVAAPLKPDHRFVFVEFRAVADAALCLEHLPSMPLHQQTLTVSRPNDYAPPPPGFETFVVPLNEVVARQDDAGLYAALGGKQATVARIDHVAPVAVAVTQAAFGAALTAATAAHMAPSLNVTPTATLLLRAIVTTSDLQEDKGYTEVFADVTGECARFGSIVDVRMPRGRDGVDAPSPIAAGDVYLRYSAIAVGSSTHIVFACLTTFTPLCSCSLTCAMQMDHTNFDICNCTCTCTCTGGYGGAQTAAWSRV